MRLSKTAPSDRLRPAPSRTMPQNGPQPIRRQQIRDWRRPQLAPETKEYLRFVRIFGLSADMTLANILEGIAQTAPVGRVLHIEWDKKGLIRHREMKVKGAMVLFDHDAAAADLVRLAKQQTFLVRGESVHVSIWAKRAFHGNVEAANASRVLHIRGPRDVENFSEEGIRTVIMENQEVVKVLGSLALDAEAVITTELGGGKRLIEWRFFSNERQAKILLLILRRLFHKSLSVDPGPDPCWNERLYPRDRTGGKDVRYLPAISKGFKWPTVREDGRSSGAWEAHHLSGSMATKAAWERDQMLRETARKDFGHETQLVQKLHGRRKKPAPLDETQRQRIAAWTEAGVPRIGKDAPHQGSIEELLDPKKHYPFRF